MEKDLISEDYVSFETAKLLKQKGFDADCAAVYDLEFPKSCADGKGTWERNPWTFVYNFKLVK